MPYLEYPKAVYLDGDVSKASKIVSGAEQEAAAQADGYLALPAQPPAEAMQPGAPDHLPYPKMLFQGGAIDGETCIVANAEQEAMKAAEGFVPLALAAPVVEDPPADAKKASKKAAKA